IKAFVTNKPITKTNLFKNNHIKVVYPERASGDIEVNIKDEKLNSIVQSIQNIIKAKNES
ncbi:MAG: hypothetical protein DRG78_12190, partial [Epsilonproteobacteria bacterium]